MLPLLLQLSSATLLVENQYFNHHCPDAPDTIYAFNVSDPFAYDPTLNETFPSYFRFHFGDVTVGDTANCYVPVPGIACTDSLAPSLSLPYLSGSTTWFDGINDLEASVPVGANGHTYCFLSNTVGDTASLLGYEAMLLLQKTGQCYDDYFECNSSGVFTYYASTGCSGAVLDQLTLSDPRNISSNHLGNITVQLKTFEAAQIFYSWSQHVPTVDLVPQFDMPIDYIAATIFGITIALALTLPISTIVEYVKAKKSYNEYLANGGDNNYMMTVNPNIINFLNNWDDASYFWIIFMFVWNCTPPLIISINLVTLKFMTVNKLGKSPTEIVKKLFQIDKYLPLLLVCQILVIAGYLILKYIKLQTPMLGNDIVYQDVTSFGTFFMIVHVVLSARINETIRIALEYNFTQTNMVTTNMPTTMYRMETDGQN
ncbi:hypothetical protein HK103_000717 [Boothiomyces macroporosus]|uniref:Uncharacterized protein n=1 Tax=Boothiomyces macroporosus TaxID=261099 RepID=A0AAD5UB54_9FUNG|nr:hypothetical protein HK103_000717 [Boothiomyces macroporosus]